MAGVFLFGGVSLFLFVIGIVLILKSMKLEKRMLSTSGTIIALDPEPKRDESGRILKTKMRFRPVIRYQTKKGDDVEFISNVGTSSHATFSKYTKLPYDVDDVVEIRYDPSHPEVAYVRSEYRSWYKGASVIFVGVIFFVFAITFLP